MEVSDDETRYRRSIVRKRNRIAKELRQNRQYLPKVIDKDKYKREKLSVKDVPKYESQDYED